MHGHGGGALFVKGRALACAMSSVPCSALDVVHHGVVRRGRRRRRRRQDSGRTQIEMTQAREAAHLVRPRDDARDAQKRAFFNILAPETSGFSLRGHIIELSRRRKIFISTGGEKVSMTDAMTEWYCTADSPRLRPVLDAMPLNP